MPNLRAVQDVFDCETIVSYVMFGNTNRLSYDRFKSLLLYGTVGSSVDAAGMVQFKKHAEFPKARRSDLHVPGHVHLPYAFLKSNIDTIIDFLSDDTSAAITTDRIVQKAVLLAGSFSRSMCGLRTEQPRLAESAFSSTRIQRLRDPSSHFAAVFETNTLSLFDVCNVFLRPRLLALQLVLSHCMVRTLFPSEWDEGHESFTHVIHRFVYKHVDVFPVYFVSDNTGQRKLWYGVRKSRTDCQCLKNVNVVPPVPLPSNDMSRGCVEQPTLPVARAEIDELRSMVVKLQEQNKFFSDQMKRQQVEINDLKILVGYRKAMDTTAEEQPPTAKQPPIAEYTSLNPFAVAKKAQSTSERPSPAVLAVNDCSTASSAVPVQTITTADAAASTSKRQTTWLNPPKKIAKILKMPRRRHFWNWRFLALIIRMINQDVPVDMWRGSELTIRQSFVSFKSITFLAGIESPNKSPTFKYNTLGINPAKHLQRL
eukprot:XP_016657100.1 PREDICTED: uncharacterized protein LOC107882762 [Acyrthosiphon pisum]